MRSVLMSTSICEGWGAGRCHVGARGYAEGAGRCGCKYLIRCKSCWGAMRCASRGARSCADRGPGRCTGVLGGAVANM